MNTPVSCDLFCAVVDNLGDAGVCWRLARQLAREHGWAVRLWIDDMTPLARLRPGIDPTLACQEADGVEIRAWHTPFPPVVPARIVIEAFACELPPDFVAVMAERPPVWINLEYLSAEDWVAGCHGMASPHPGLPLVKHFFFPGFGPGTGGLIREKDADFGCGERHEDLRISLFCYDNPALPHLLDRWAAGPESIDCIVADGLPRRQVESWLGNPFPIGQKTQREALTLRAAPFVSQLEYDRLLGRCDLNFVRGEDSFVRAQWAAQPFVWQIYPQADDAHHTKLEAFLTRYTHGLDMPAREAVATFSRAWNGSGAVADAWPSLRAALPSLGAWAKPWAGEIAAAGNLADNLACFCRKRL
ncbi:hypothetical protein RHDC4_00715 [Rhodocyclaceae bacterium]|nr:hypothetical protein RHDC4_00715 [Rhodocyclaceae bacterium]